MKNEMDPRELSIKVLHILDHSLPYVSEYSLRSHFLIKLQRDIGINPLVITSPRQAIDSSPLELIEGVFHYRTFFPEDTLIGWRNCPIWKGKQLISTLSQAISRIADNERIDLIHAHSPFINGLAALEVSRTRKIPLLYEMSGFHENSAPSIGLWNADCLLTPSLGKNLEAFLCRQAEAVEVMENDQREHIIRQGIPEENVYVFPTGDIVQLLTSVQWEEVFSSLTHSPGSDLLEKFKNNPAAGFLCSFYYQQGVIPLLRTLLKEGIERSVSIGREEEQKREEAGSEAKAEKAKFPRHDASGHIIYVGQVKSEKKARYHSMIDVFVYPWLKTDETSVLPPLPIEAFTLDEDDTASGMNDPYGLTIDRQEILKEGDISSLTGRCLKLIMSRQIQQNREDATRQRASLSLFRLRIMAHYLNMYKKLLTP
ncbi:MAG: glycosyltransferase [bacterium]